MADVPMGSRSAKAANLQVDGRQRGSGMRAEEVGELYTALAVRLHQIVGARVRAPEPVIEDACQFAWSTLIRYRGSVRRDSALAWLATTASRDALRQLRRDGRNRSLEQLAEEGVRPATRASVTSIEELVEQRARLETIGRLPERQQRLMWLQGLGLSYTEMAEHEDATPRTVERQLMRAKKRLREAA
jgi:RNA polymerase sigma factor (sigma-70 family)